MTKCGVLIYSTVRIGERVVGVLVEDGKLWIRERVEGEKAKETGTRLCGIEIGS